MTLPMSSVNLYEDNINTYNITKQILFKNIYAIKISEEILKYFINQKINKSTCFKEHIIPTTTIESIIEVLFTK